MSPQSEAEVRAAYAAHRFGMPLTGQMLQGSLPFYPTLPGLCLRSSSTIHSMKLVTACVTVIDGDYSNPSSPSFIQKQMQALEQAQQQNLITAMYHAGPITDTQVNEGVMFNLVFIFHSSSGLIFV